MAEWNNQSWDLITEQIDIEPETFESSDNNIAEETILEKVLASDNIIEDSKKWLLDLKQEIWKKVDTVQDKAGEIKDSVTDWANDIYKTTTNYLWEKADTLQKYKNLALETLFWTKSALAGLKEELPNIKPDNDPKKDRWLLDEYKEKEQIEKNKKREQAERFLQMDVEESALDILDWSYTPTTPEDGEVIKLFKNIPLDKIFEAHNKATSYNDFQDVSETYWDITQDITKQYIWMEIKRIMQQKYKNQKWWNNKLPIWILDPKKPFSDKEVNKLLESSEQKLISPEFKRKLIEKSKARSKELINKIWYFLRKEKWWEFENIANNKKKYPNIWALLTNRKFEEFINEEQKLFKKDVSFNDFKNEQIKWLRDKLTDTQKVDLLSPFWLSYDVMFWDNVVKNTIVFKWENFPEDKRWFYIGWYKYKFDWIKNITGMLIDWEDLVIKRKIWWIENTDIKLSKTKLVEWLKDLIFEWKLTVPTSDLKKDIFIQRDIT